MAMVGDGRAGFGECEEIRKSPSRPDTNEEPQNVSHEAERNNPTGLPDQHVSIYVGVSEVEQMMKQMTFTRSESDAMITQLASPQDPTAIENLSEDLLSKIFIRLLAKHLAQMRSVSKFWNSLLTQPSFVKSHLHRSINTNDQTLLAFYYSSFFLPKPLTVIPCQSPDLDLTNLIKLPPVTPGSHGNRIIVIGSVHGLICSHYINDVIRIWNPSLSAMSSLPPYLGPRGDLISLRFGFDPTTDDYKVVKISEPKGCKEWPQVEIYSMRKGCWKLITERVPPHLSRISNREFVCVDGHDGHLHWFGYIGEKREPHTILAFDLGLETFCEMNLPDSVLLDDNDNRFCDLGVLGGKVCVVSGSCGENGVCEVWVMEEYGVAESWVKRHTFSTPQFVNPTFSGFTSGNEFIYENTNSRLVLYDPATDTARILEKSLEDYGRYNIVEYIDSLVWV